MDKYLCLCTNSVMSERTLRRTRIRQMMLSSNPDNWSEKVYAIGKMRRIYSTPRPEGNWVEGYEEREDGKLYQTWSQL